MDIKCDHCSRTATRYRLDSAELYDFALTCAPHAYRHYLPLPRVGPAMLRVLRAVDVRPGATKCAIADVVGPHGSRKYGYRAVDRAIAVGLVHAGGDLHRYWLSLTPLGRELLRYATAPRLRAHTLHHDPDDSIIIDHFYGPESIHVDGQTWDEALADAGYRRVEAWCEVDPYQCETQVYGTRRYRARNQTDPSVPAVTPADIDKMCGLLRQNYAADQALGYGEPE